MDLDITIDARFCGPPDSGNGGYSAGLLAERLDAAAAQVTLRKPPPLATPMTVVEADGRLAMMHGDMLIAEAQPGELTPQEPPALTFDDARRAVEATKDLAPEAFPTCFSCGRHRSPDNGLKIYPSPAGDGIFAALWEVRDDLPLDENGAVSEPIMWAALDCSGGFAITPALGAATVVLGRMTARIDRHAKPGETLLVTGKPISAEGRKGFSRTWITSEDGEVLGRSEQTWIRIG